MSTSNWVVENDELLLRNSAGQIIIPSASEVYESIFGKTKTIQGIGLPSSPSNLTFSKFPINLVMEIVSRNEADNPLWVTVAGKQKNIDIEISSILSRRTDHIIVQNKWYPFPQGSLNAIRDLLHSAGIENLGPLTLREYLKLKESTGSNADVQDLTRGSVGAAQISKSSIPVGYSPLFKGHLYPFQEDGYRWLSWIASQDLGCILGDEMGLGKTIQVIALLASHHKTGFPSLIVAPATLLENWRRELDRFAPALRTTIHQGSARTGFPSDLTASDVVVTSYGTTARDLPLLKMVDWNVVALDEAQAIKNPGAERTVVVKQIPRHIGIAITGTPVENSLTDLWSITDFAIPGLLGPQVKFEEIFDGTPESAERLEPLVSPVILRRRVDEVARDLPERIEIPQPLMLDQSEASEYEEIRRQAFEQYGKGATLAALTRLRMFCTHPFLVGPLRGDPASRSNKYRRLLEILEEIFDNEQKALIFTSFNEMSDILVDDLPQRFQIYCNRIYGEVRPSKRQPIVDEFASHEGPGVLVLNPKAAGTGLNITSANHVIHYNLEWNPAVEDQATARSFRKGQTLPVTVHRLFYVQTVEEVMDERLSRKRTVADRAVVGIKGEQADYDDLMRALALSPQPQGSL